MFLPGQFSRFYEVARAPEGSIHFAGEHLFNSHNWIAGALHSRLAAVRQILDEDIPALGPNASPREEERPPAQGLALDGTKNSGAETSKIASILSRFMIPLHLNVQYVEAFQSGDYG